MKKPVTKPTTKQEAFIFYLSERYGYSEFSLHEAANVYAHFASPGISLASARQCAYLILNGIGSCKDFERTQRGIYRFKLDNTSKQPAKLTTSVCVAAPPKPIKSRLLRNGKEATKPNKTAIRISPVDTRLTYSEILLLKQLLIKLAGSL